MEHWNNGMMEGRPDGTMRIMINPCAPDCHLDRRLALSPSCHLDRRPQALSCHLDRRPQALSCHLDRRPQAGAERSGCERAVSGICARVHRPGRESFRPRGSSRYGATSDSQPDVSTALRSARHDKRKERSALDRTREKNAPRSTGQEKRTLRSTGKSARSLPQCV
jgi:hypothetical protein